MTDRILHCFGYASDLAAASAGASLGPAVLKASTYFSALQSAGVQCKWHEIFKPSPFLSNNKIAAVKDICATLGSTIAEMAQQKNFFMVVGGDHSSAIGTWSGASEIGDLGLIWIDAHMDSHTPETSESGNVHGMPLAVLLGKGDASLVQLFNRSPKIKPENVCLIGVRSFEAGEELLLKNMQVRVFYMDEVKARGLDVVLQEAIEIVTRNTVGYGLTLDIDSIDPKDAPGTGVAEPDGILGDTLCKALLLLAKDPRLIGFEIVEFDPSRDKNKITEQLIVKIISALIFKKILSH